MMEFIDLHAQRRRLGDKIDRAIASVLEHGKFIMGPEVRALEERLASYCGVRHAVGVKPAWYIVGVHAVSDGRPRHARGPEHCFGSAMFPPMRPMP